MKHAYYGELENFFLNIFLLTRYFLRTKQLEPNVSKGFYEVIIFKGSSTTLKIVKFSTFGKIYFVKSNLNYE